MLIAQTKLKIIEIKLVAWLAFLFRIQSWEPWYNSVSEGVIVPYVSLMPTCKLGKRPMSFLRFMKGHHLNEVKNIFNTAINFCRVFPSFCVMGLFDHMVNSAFGSSHNNFFKYRKYNI